MCVSPQVFVELDHTVPFTHCLLPCSPVAEAYNTPVALPRLKLRSSLCQRTALLHANENRKTKQQWQHRQFVNYQFQASVLHALTGFDGLLH